MLRSPRPKLAVAADRHRLVHQFFALLQRQRASLMDVADRAGYSHVALVDWKRRKEPTVAALEAALNVIGYRIIAVPRVNPGELPVLRNAPRPRPSPAPRGHPAVRVFFAAAAAARKSLGSIEDHAGVSHVTSRWRRSTCPLVGNLDACLMVLGWHLVIVPLEEGELVEPSPMRAPSAALAIALTAVAAFFIFIHLPPALAAERKIELCISRHDLGVQLAIGGVRSPILDAISWGGSKIEILVNPHTRRWVMVETDPQGCARAQAAGPDWDGGLEPESEGRK